MTKKTIALLVALLIVVSLVGCKKETPKERLEKAFENSMNLKTATQEFDMSANISVPEEEINKNPMIGMFVGMINQAKLKGKFEIDQESFNMAGKINAAVSGMSYEMEIYYSPEKYVVKLPMQEKYMVLYEGKDENLNENKEEMKKLSKTMSKSLLELIKDENIQIQEDKKLDINGKEVSVTPIVISFNDKEFKEVIKSILPKLYDNPMFMKYTIENAKRQSILLGEEKSEEEIKKELEQGKEEINKGLNELDNVITIKKVNLVYFLNKNNDVVSSQVDINVNLKADGETQRPDMYLGINANSKIYNINQEISIQIPEITEENSMKMEDMKSRLQ
ncbi:MAG: hypothetical protein N4A57_06945 [Anaeromicrobium sp.]|jgi:hypothetical protein|uniref:hypothetical protein n=1 Tax=Anaeromicrobium sp. TaxID=1929132 RepID=UPI0025CF2EC6|nr:hypothetical protein [Anaeromicrobium sp.]MCT4593985.1 hypothetical protein [Anaeromicrobium sp.]